MTFRWALNLLGFASAVSRTDDLHCLGLNSGRHAEWPQPRGSSSLHPSPDFAYFCLHHMADVGGGPPSRPPFRLRTIQHLLRRPAHLRAWAKRTSAPRRHRIWKVTLADTLFNLLDIWKLGALGIDELHEFALLTGSQGHTDELHDLVAQLLDTWGSPLRSRFRSNRICMLQFRRIVSHSGPLHMWKFELRRTIRFARAMTPAWAYTLGDFSLCRRYTLAKISRVASQWRQGIFWQRCDPAFLPVGTRHQWDPQSAS